MNRIQLQAKAFLERRNHRIEKRSDSIIDRDINFARYARWITIRLAPWLREAGIEISAGSEDDFFRSEIERFEAWDLKENRASGLYQQLQSMSDDELIRHYHELKNQLIAHFKNESSEPKAERSF